MKPECIVLDEPTAMLDPKGRDIVMKTVKNLNREYGITVVFITHYMEEAALADRIVILSDGKIVKNGPPKEIFGDVDGVRALGLDVPQVTGLCYILNKNGVDIPAGIISVDECVARLAGLLGGTI